MPLKLAEYGDLFRLVDELKKPFETRNTKWAARRKVRYRRMESELRALPLNPTISDQALMVYQTEAPNQEVHKRVKRLVANEPRFEVVVYDNDAKIQQMGQELEDGVKALYKWMNRGKVSFDWKVTQFQQGDGLGIGKVDFIPGHGDVLAAYENDAIVADDEDEDEEDLPAVERNARMKRNQARGAYRDALTKYEGDEEKAYDKVTDDALRRELPPFRMPAVDPLVCVWREDDDGIEIIAEQGTKPLNPLLHVFKSYGLRLTDDGKRLEVVPGGGDVMAGPTAPDSAVGDDVGQRVKYTEIRTRSEIAIIIEHPDVAKKGKKAGADLGGRGVKMVFTNPFGPYTTGYVLVPGDVTTETDEADKYQPPALAAIAGAQTVNVLMTARISAALEHSLASKYVEVSPDTNLPPQSEDKTPTVKEGTNVPFIPGKVKRIDTPTVDLDKADARVVADMAESKFQDVLGGDAASDATGHRLAIQVGQADLQMVPYQNSRKKAIEELMKGILYAVRKHGLTVYIPTIPDGPRTGNRLRVAEPAKLTPEMADMDFELIVTLGSETAVTKFAKEQHLAQQEQEGTIGYQSLVEAVAENPEDEIARVVEGKLFKGTLDGLIPFIVQNMQQYLQQKLFPPPPVAPEAMGIPPETGMAGGGGAVNPGANPMAPQNIVRLPGQGMPVVQSTSEEGPTVPEPY